MSDITTKTALRNDYTPGPFTASFKKDTDLFYTSFFHEARLGEDERIQFTGRILAVMLHPQHGTVVFYLQNNDGKWVPDNNTDTGIEPDLLDWCNEQISKHLS
ncbi:hypothetical protein [Deminuibacter soli]|uniref:Uncharacterized protein n=1 Tax=Deminuibacter soli TaxID=2291815 RepID=A0A3E1NJZ4_9BACT|nr:hypothetical protein [Deminuibacter soli]RFM28249.1 hypothetical protein DXN05_12095 [Deminuibacter soli]